MEKKHSKFELLQKIIKTAFIVCMISGSSFNGRQLCS